MVLAIATTKININNNFNIVILINLITILILLSILLVIAKRKQCLTQIVQKILGRKYHVYSGPKKMRLWINLVRYKLCS